MDRKRLSIGIFIDTFYPMVDGVVLVVDNYAKLLSEYHDVTVFTIKPHDKNFKIDRPYKIVRCHKTKFPFTDYELSLPFIDREFRRVLRKSHFDIVHIHSPFTIGEMGVKYAKRRNIPVVSTYHSQYKQDFLIRTKSEALSEVLLKQIMKVFNKCDLSFAVNKKVRDVYEAYGSTVKTLVRNNGTDLMPFTDKEEIKALRNKYSIKDHEKVFLFVGRIDIVKNIHFIVDSLRELTKLGFAYKMLFVGTGLERENLEIKIKEYNLQDHIIFTGKIMGRVEISKYYKLADLFLFPSLYDSSSLVQIEAASQGTPALFLDGAVTADTIDKNINGYTARNNCLAYAKEIVRIFENTEEYQKVCRNTVDQIYKTWDNVVYRTYLDYMDLISKNKEKEER